MATTKEDEYSFKEAQYGVWNVNYATPKAVFRRWSCHQMMTTALVLRQTVHDIYSLSPVLCRNILLCTAWEVMDAALVVRFENALMCKVESAYITKSPDILGIARISVAHLFTLIMTNYLYCVRHRMLTTQRTMISIHYDTRLLRARLGRNPSMDDIKESTTNGEEVTSAIMSLMRNCTWAITFAAQLVAVAQLSRTAGGIWFFVLALVHPIICIFYEFSNSSKPYLAKLNNQHDKRMRDLDSFSREKKYRRDVVTGGLGGWIVREYAKAVKLQGTIPRAQPQELFNQNEDAFSRIAKIIFAHMPTIFVAVSAIINPRSFTLASTISVQSSTAIIRSTLISLPIVKAQIEKAIRTLHSVASEEALCKSTSNDGRPYPVEGLSKAQGMSFDLRDVSFSYPGSKSTLPALERVGLSITPGQIVVIVGHNGCGKSTLIRMLARMYEPTSGEVLVDNEPIGSYKMHDLWRASALLSQENELYPVSLFENISLGLPESSRDVGSVKDAAEKAGAWSVLEKLNRGLNTEVVGFGHYSVLSTGSSNDADHPLKKQQEELEKNLNVSSGEKQRVVAARTFMRLCSGDVKFVAVDEPSSALDAEAELRLFQNLIANREGKTMIFVTHHFGHLTKYADQIICMKEGTVVETGSHDELMLGKGEYAKLYNIQALSFQHSSSN